MNGNNRLAAFLGGAGGAFLLAVVIFVLALVGRAGIGLAALLGGVMALYGVVLLAGRRSDFISVLAGPGSDERSVSAHTRAAAAAGQVIALVIVGAFLVDVARGNFNLTVWVALGAVFGVTYLVALLWFVRRG